MGYSYTVIWQFYRENDEKSWTWSDFETEGAQRNWSPKKSWKEDLTLISSGFVGICVNHWPSHVIKAFSLVSLELFLGQRSVWGTRRHGPWADLMSGQQYGEATFKWWHDEIFQVNDHISARLLWGFKFLWHGKHVHVFCQVILGEWLISLLISMPDK